MQPWLEVRGGRNAGQRAAGLTGTRKVQREHRERPPPRERRDPAATRADTHGQRGVRGGRRVAPIDFLLKDPEVTEAKMRCIEVRHSRDEERAKIESRTM